MIITAAKTSQNGRAIHRASSQVPTTVKAKSTMAMLATR